MVAVVFVVLLFHFAINRATELIRKRMCGSRGGGVESQTSLDLEGGCPCAVCKHVAVVRLSPN